MPSRQPFQHLFLWAHTPRIPTVSLSPPSSALEFQPPSATFLDSFSSQSMELKSSFCRTSSLLLLSLLIVLASHTKSKTDRTYAFRTQTLVALTVLKFASMFLSCPNVAFASPILALMSQTLLAFSSARLPRFSKEFIFLKLTPPYLYEELNFQLTVVFFTGVCY